MAYSPQDAQFRESVTKKLKDINYILIAVIIVLIIAFVSLLVTVQGLVITYQHDNAESYQGYRDELTEQNDQIRDLKNEIKMMHGRD